MNEPMILKKKHTTKLLVLFGAIFVVALFVVGYLVGGSLSSTATSSEVDKLRQQVASLQQKNNEIKYQNITYVYNDTFLSAIYENQRKSIVVINGLVPYYSFFGMGYSTVQGSGFVYEFNNEMVVVTNNHVVNDTVNLTVTFSNGDSYLATVIGTDAYSDLAVVSVQAPMDEFQPLEIVSSSGLKVGDPVIAIGSPFGLSGTMTTGIISQLGRTIKESLAGSFPIADIIQTSVPINPGNSGGPLLNYQGEVVGITAAILQNSNGLGFAIPSNTILKEIDSLVRTGSYTQHPWVGISGADMSYALAQAMGVNVTYGWLITQVTNGGAADNAGLKGGSQQVRINDQWTIIGGDIIIAVDGTRIINGDSFMSYLEEHAHPKQVITVTIIRGTQHLEISMELGTRPSVG
jgi:S1-C subfamily serine protease